MKLLMLLAGVMSVPTFAASGGDLDASDYVGVSFWLVTAALLAATAFFFVERDRVAAKWKTSTSSSSRCLRRRNLETTRFAPRECSQSITVGGRDFHWRYATPSRRTPRTHARTAGILIEGRSVVVELFFSFPDQMALRCSRGQGVVHFRSTTSSCA